MSNWKPPTPTPVQPTNASDPLLCKLTHKGKVEDVWLHRDKTFDETVEMLVHEYSVENADDLIFEFSRKTKDGEEMKGIIKRFSWDLISRGAGMISASIRERNEPRVERVQERQEERREERGEGPREERREKRREVRREVRREGRRKKRNVRRVENVRAQKGREPRVQRKHEKAIELEAMIKQGKSCTYCQDTGRTCFVPERGAVHEQCHYCFYGHKECRFTKGTSKTNEKELNQPDKATERPPGRILLERNIARGMRCEECVKADVKCEANEENPKEIHCAHCVKNHHACQFAFPDGDRLSYEEEGSENDRIMVE